jgi:hypothetical protein
VSIPSAFTSSFMQRCFKHKRSCKTRHGNGSKHGTDGSYDGTDDGAHGNAKGAHDGSNGAYGANGGQHDGG